MVPKIVGAIGHKWLKWSKKILITKLNVVTERSIFIFLMLQ